MTIIINNIAVDTNEGETVIEVARSVGIVIPSLCYAKDAIHKSSCMICAVKDCRSGQIIPSCSTVTAEGMSIDTDSEEVIATRRLSLELLLSDHRADCEAPCTLVCPYNLDVEQVIYYFDCGDFDKAYKIIAATFPLPQLKCTDCKAPCEKACRRGTIDKPVSIREAIKSIISDVSTEINDHLNNKLETRNTGSKENKLKQTSFMSRLGRFTEEEKIRLKATIKTTSRCLHCTCAGKNGCKLREYATMLSIKRTRYDVSSSHHAIIRQKIRDKLCFEPAKCIKCGLCVYNSSNGFTFRNRGFRMEVFLPEENVDNIDLQLEKLCPTGAIYRID